MDEFRVVQLYRKNAPMYDAMMRGWLRIRADCVRRLELNAGMTVLDLGCGTGLAFESLRSAVGPSGRIIAADLSPDMLMRARARVSRQGWRNVEIVEANAETLRLEEPLDGVLSVCTHDIMASSRAVQNAVDKLVPRGRFVAAGIKLTSGLRGIVLNPLTHASALRGTIHPVTAKPWSHLESALGSVELEERCLGMAYIAVAVKR